MSKVYFVDRDSSKSKKDKLDMILENLYRIIGLLESNNYTIKKSKKDGCGK